MTSYPMIPTITAHSGCDNTPADSLESVSQGIASGADIVEIDVRMSRDRILVLSHDFDSSLYYPDSPRVEAAFEIILAVNGTAVNCDVKEAAAIPAILELAGRCRIPKDRLYLSGSVTPGILRRIPDLMERCRVLWNLEEALVPFAEKKLIEEKRGDLLPVLYSDLWRVLREHLPDPDPYAEQLVSLAGMFAIDTFNMPFQIATDERIMFFSRNGFGVSVWTVDEPEMITQYLRAGVRNITTRNAKTAVQLKTQFFRQQDGNPIQGRTGAAAI